MSLSVDIGLIVATLLSLRLMFFEKKISIFKTIILFIFSVLLSVNIFSLGSDIHKIASYPRYTATITHVDKHVKSSGYGEDYIVYKPTYTFNDGQKGITIKSLETGRNFKIGDRVNIAYQNGDFLGSAIDMFILVIYKVFGAFLSYFILYNIMGIVFIKRSSIRKYHSFIDDIIVLLFLFSFLLPLSLKFIYMILE